MHRTAAPALFTALILALALTLALPGAARADAPQPREGVYTVTGTDPGDAAPYTGRAELRRQGGAYVFQGIFGGVQYEGTGLFDPQTGILGLAFKASEGNDSGLTLLRLDGMTLSGRWTAQGDPQGRTGHETWTWSGPAD